MTSSVSHAMLVTTVLEATEGSLVL